MAIVLRLLNWFIRRLSEQYRTLDDPGAPYPPDRTGKGGDTD